MKKKHCKRCGKLLPLNQFHKQTATKDGLRTWCKACSKANYNVWRKANRQRLNDLIRASKLRRRGVSITVTEIAKLEETQEGRCAICRKAETLVRTSSRSVLSVDHCHKTNRVRGLLCRRCNTGIANFDDDPKRLLAAVAYLTK